MRITKIGVTTAVDTTLPDKYCKPYDGRVYGSDGRLTQPMSRDWHIIRYQVVTNGERGQTVEVTRGVGAGVTNDHAVFTSIGSAADGVYVWLEDYAGNTSEEVYVNNRLNVSVSSESSTVQAGTTAQFTATVKNFSKTDKVTWSISGSNSPETKIDANGVLTVSAMESTRQIKVTATSKAGAEFSSTVRLTPLYAIFSPPNAQVAKGKTKQFVIKNKKTGEEQPAADFTWTVTGEYGSEVTEKTTIDEAGLFTMGDDVGDNDYFAIHATHKATDAACTAYASLPYEWYAAVSETPVAQSAPMPTPVAETEPIQKVLWTVEGARTEPADAG